MNEALISSLLLEIRGECGIPSSISDAVLTSFLKEGVHDIQQKVSLLVNFETDFSCRALLKAFVRYSYYGLRDEFKMRYDTEYLEAQVRYICV